MIFTVAWLTWLVFARESYAAWSGGIRSPDGDMTAQIFEYSTYGDYWRYEIYLRNANRVIRLSTKVADLSAAKVNSCAAGVDLVWTSDSDLEIRFLQADYSQIPHERVRVGGRWVTVKLVPQSTNNSARCGSMKGRS